MKKYNCWWRQDQIHIVVWLVSRSLLESLRKLLQMEVGGVRTEAEKIIGKSFEGLHFSFWSFRLRK